jgi:hypothetical protein
MIRSSGVLHKKQRKRRREGHDPVLALRLPVDVSEKIEEWAKRNGIPSRSAAIRLMIDLALKKRPE